jgi:hypothetical protein
MDGRARVIYDVRTSRTPPSLISARNQSPSVLLASLFFYELACIMPNDERDIRRIANKGARPGLGRLLSVGATDHKPGCRSY